MKYTDAAGQLNYRLAVAFLGLSFASVLITLGSGISLLFLGLTLLAFHLVHVLRSQS